MKRKRSVLGRLALAAALLGATGCASLGNSKRQTIPVESDPPGASASYDGQLVTTPGAIVVLRKSSHVSIRFEKAGYAPCVLALERERDGAFWANLVFIPVGVFAGGALGYYGVSDSRGINGWGQALVGGMIGGVVLPVGTMVVDTVNGRGYEQSPDRVKVVLAPLGPRQELATPGSEPPCAPSRSPSKA